MKVFQLNNIVAGLLVLMFALILAVDALLVHGEILAYRYLLMMSKA